MTQHLYSTAPLRQSSYDNQFPDESTWIEEHHDELAGDLVRKLDWGDERSGRVLREKICDLLNEAHDNYQRDSV